MGVLAPMSAHAGHSAQPPIDTSGNFPARMSAESISPHWSERRCADGFVESAVGHYFWYFSTLVVDLVTTVAKMV